jgi:hypothetical protein
MIPLLSTLLGSTLIVSFVTNLLSTINHPDIVITADRRFDQESKENSRLHPGNTNLQRNAFINSPLLPSKQSEYNLRVYDLTIKNKGNQAAHSVTITLNFPDATGKIRIQNLIEGEKIRTWDIGQDNSIASTNISRLASGSGIQVRSSIPVNDTENYGGDTSCIINVSYNEGSNQADPCLQFAPSGGSSFQLLIIAPFIAPIILGAVLYIYSKLKKGPVKREKEFIISIIEDVARFQKGLEDSPQKTFDGKLWHSKRSEEKLQIFSDYEDYNTISNFYSCVKERHSTLSHRSIDQQSLKYYNDDCTRSASAVFQIDWTKYHINSMSIKKRTIALAKAIFGSLAISYTSALVFVIFVNGIHNFFEPLSYLSFFIISFTIRAVAAYIITRKIIKTSTFAYKFSDFNIRLEKRRKHNLLKLLLISAVMMGLSFMGIFVLLFQININLVSPLTSKLGTDPYMLYLILIIFDVGLDILKMLLIIFVIPQRLVQHKFKSLGYPKRFPGIYKQKAAID